MKTFAVSPVQPATKVLDRSVAALKTIFSTNLESHSLSEEAIVSPQHNFIAMLNKAYDLHYPVVLSPDHIWLLISQSLAAHVNKNSSKLRSKFVAFEGRQTITIEEPGFIKGQQNPWDQTFDKFATAIEGYIGPSKNLIVADFSTTGSVEKAVSSLVLMDAIQSFFEYRVMTMCGIPEITLLGTLEDWEAILARTRMLAEYDFGWYTEKIIPHLEQFISVFKDYVDTGFWQNVYKVRDQSGGPHISGWIRDFFAYDKDGNKNDAAWRLANSDRYPSGLAKVPFIWDYYGKEYKMEMGGGFAGFKQNEDLSLISLLGWGVWSSQ